MKKVYQAPKMRVVLSHSPQILTVSEEGFNRQINDEGSEGYNAI